MEQINKLLILLTGLSIGAIIYIIVSAIDMMNNQNIVAPTHPYDKCIKILIDQVNKENKQSDFDSIKSVCFGLLDKEKQLEK